MSIQKNIDGLTIYLMIYDTNDFYANHESENCLKSGKDFSPLCAEPSSDEEFANSESNKSLVNTCCISQEIISDEKVVHKYIINKSDNLVNEDHSSKVSKELAVEAHNAIELAKIQNRKSVNGILCGAALRMPDGKIITGLNSSLFHSATAVIIKACKAFVELPDDVFLLSSVVIESIGRMKEVVYKKEEPSLDVRELLIALAVESPMNPSVSKVLELFPKFNGCEMHLTHIPTLGDQSGLEKLGIRFTYDQVPSA